MSVALRYKKNKDGSQTAFLDIYENKVRRKKNIGIRIYKSDTDKKEKKKRAEAIRTKYHNELLDKKFDIVSEDKRESDFILYAQNFIKEHKGAGIKKYIYAYEKFLDYLIFKRIIKEKGEKDLRYKFHVVNHRIPFNKLDYKLCKDFKDYLYSEDSKLTGETPYDYFKRFRAIINQASKESFLLEVPTAEIKIKKPESNLKKLVLTEDELRKLARIECGGFEVKRAFLFACFTGLGAAEMKELKWANVKNGRLNTKRSKNGNPIESKLGKTVISLLGEKGPDNQKIFKFASDTTVSKHLKKWMERAEIDKHITFYCGRHTFAVLSLLKGASIVTVSKLMGHKDISSTMKYLNYIKDQEDQAIDNLPVLDI